MSLDDRKCHHKLKYDVIDVIGRPWQALLFCVAATSVRRCFLNCRQVEVSRSYFIYDAYASYLISSKIITNFLNLPLKNQCYVPSSPTFDRHKNRAIPISALNNQSAPTSVRRVVLFSAHIYSHFYFMSQQHQETGAFSSQIHRRCWGRIFTEVSKVATLNINWPTERQYFFYRVLYLCRLHMPMPSLPYIITNFWLPWTMNNEQWTMNMMHYHELLICSLKKHNILLSFHVSHHPQTFSNMISLIFSF